MIYVGMDIHKKTTTFCAIDEQGKVIRRSTLPSGEAGWLEITGHWSPGEVEVALETGCMTWWAVDVLREAGIDPVVVDARQFKMIADSKKKSGRHDARVLAESLRGGLAQRCAVNAPGQKARRARALMQTRQHILKQCNMTINAAKALLGSVGVELKRAQWPKDCHWEKVLDNPAVPIWMKPLLITHRSTWQQLEKQRQGFDVLINQEFSHWPEAELLLDMPGIAPFATMGIISGIGEIKRFGRANQLTSYAGLIPCSRNRGPVQRRGGITRQGRSPVRHFAVQAALAAMRGKSLTPPLQKWAKSSIVKRGWKVAAVVSARKPLVLAHSPLSTGEAYNPAFPVVA